MAPAHRLNKVHQYAGRDGQVAVIDLATGIVIHPSLGSAYSGTTVSVRYNLTGSRVLVSSGGGQLAFPTNGQATSSP